MKNRKGKNKHFLTNLSMSELENDIEEELQYFTRIWLTYFDDIFTILGKKIEFDDFLSLFNNRFLSMKFMLKIEIK